MIEITSKLILNTILYLVVINILLKVNYTFLSDDLNRKVHKILIGVLSISLFIIIGIVGCLLTVKPVKVYTDKTQIVSLDGVQLKENTLYTESGTELIVDIVVLNKNSSMYDNLYTNILMQRKLGPFVFNSKAHMLELSKMNYGEYKSKNYENIYLVSDDNMHLNIPQNSSTDSSKKKDGAIKGFK